MNAKRHLGRFSPIPRWVLYAFGLGGLIGVALFREWGIVDLWKQHERQKHVPEENARIKEESRRLKQEILLLRTSREKIEAEARKIGYIYPGESVIRMKLDNGTTVRIYWRPDNMAFHFIGWAIQSPWVKAFSR